MRIISDQKPHTIILDDQSTWPSEVVDYLNKNHKIFYLGSLYFEGELNKPFDVKRHDETHNNLRSKLLPFNLKGYHCTKLTESEISIINDNGMKLQNLDSLVMRIDRLLEDGKITLEIANKLKAENEASHENRSNMLYFIFFQHPKEAGESQIVRFFSCWGGEALYVKHEHDPITGIILKKLGVPCIIEADIPISSLSASCLTNVVSNIFLRNLGFDIGSSYYHRFSTYSKKDIPPDNIKKIHKFPEFEFIKLSGCDSWNKKL